jgi:GAF domain-containing protein
MTGSPMDVSELLRLMDVQLDKATGSRAAWRDGRVGRERDAVLEPQQAALRRVAMVVAGGATSPEVFAAIAREVARVLDAGLVVIWRHEPERAATVLGAWSNGPHPFQVGTSWPVEDSTAAALLRDLGRPSRIEDFGKVGGAIPDAMHETGFLSGTGAAIIVDGEFWGVMGVGVAEGEPLLDQIEDRLAEFTELVATAISNSASRAQLAQLADEQVALRRVAALVARGVAPSEVLAAVAREVGLLLGVDVTYMARYEPDRTATGVATWSRAGDQIPVGTRVNLEGDSVAGLVFRTGRPARMQGYENARGAGGALGRELGLRSSVGTPIVVDQNLWGVMIASSKHDPELPVDAEARIADFTELLATAISNADSRAALAQLAEEQAALRRVGKLVAHGVSPEEVFAAVVEEIGRLLPVEYAGMGRFEPDHTVTYLAAWGRAAAPVPDDSQLSLGGKNLATIVRETGGPARIDNYADASGPLGVAGREAGTRSAVGTPILVDGRLWGVMAAGSTLEQPLPEGTEARLASFTELLATAIANAEARTELAASRTRILAATDEERRRVVRDLHDGAQQRLVHTVMTLELARTTLQGQEADVSLLVSEALDHAQQAAVELGELAHGILPAILTRAGLRASVDALASRMPVPVDNGVAVGRLPDAVEATAYFVVAEALTNVSKHARAGRAVVTARIEDGTLRVEVRDDGAGGARPDGSGLLGLGDRVAALDGRLWVESPAGGGTLVAADIPVAG